MNEKLVLSILLAILPPFLKFYGAFISKNLENVAIE